MAWADQLILEWLTPLAIWVLLNGADDLFVDFARFGFWLRERRAPRIAPARPLCEPKIALLIPCWREADVIEQMLEHNLAAIEYDRYDIWLGLYPNDPESIERVQNCAERHPRVHYVVGPEPGPTTKADCLNHLIDGLLQHEVRTETDYEVFLQHDAEDLIHPRALDRVARWTRRYDMVQIPVFPLATTASELTHGVYCDDFADGHQRELPARWRLGGFVPSAGVGTALRREALDQLRISYGNEVFDPGSLTEDYFLGLRLQQLGFSQAFALELGDGGPIATRAYFPRTLTAAVKQRTRWTIGNVLQSWERFGWCVGDRWCIRNGYWLWRDRKGVVNHPVALLANLLFAVGILGAAAATWRGETWALGAAITSRAWLSDLLLANAVMLGWRQAARVWWSSRVYGWKFAGLAPMRALWANVINAIAGVRALAIFLNAKWRRRPLRWAKTQHAYPLQAPGPLKVDFEIQAAGLLNWEQAALLEIVPLRLEGPRLAVASLHVPTLAAERRLSQALRREVVMVQVTASEFARLRDRFEIRARAAAAVGGAG
jgi:adsorption protein B